VVDAAFAPRAYLIHNATLVTLQPLAAAAGPQARIEAEDMGILGRGCLLVENGVITAAGAYAACAERIAHARSRFGSSLGDYDAGGRLVVPGFVDAHTHALFAGDRVADFEDLAAGRTPRLGMAHTIAATRCASEDELVAYGRERLDRMRRHGTTTVEIKSGYDLTRDGELRLLAVCERLDGDAGQPRVVATFCGAHALPPEFDTADEFIAYLCSDVVEAVARQGVARFADAFCETGFFSPDQCERFLRACAARGLRPRLHADELSRSGGAELAARLRAICADHLTFITPADIAALANAGCLAVLCPATAAFLGLPRHAPARDLMAAGVPVALATDFNPGTCPCFSLQMVIHIARRWMGLHVHEALAAVTLNAAYSLGLAGELGSLTPGKRADVLILGVRDLREVGYWFGVNLVSHAFVGTKSG
jgi:imidazolonepropionase